MSHKVTSVYVLAFDIEEYDLHSDIEQMPDYVDTYEDLEKLGATRILDFSEAQAYLNTCTELQEPEIDTCWWKLVYVLGKEG